VKVEKKKKKVKKVMDEFEDITGNIDNIETLRMLKDALSKPVQGRTIKKPKKVKEDSKNTELSSPKNFKEEEVKDSNEAT
jgi:hypothetical protein